MGNFKLSFTVFMFMVCVSVFSYLVTPAATPYFIILTIALALVAPAVDKAWLNGTNETTFFSSILLMGGIIMGFWSTWFSVFLILFALSFPFLMKFNLSEFLKYYKKR